ncbi:predicted protein [Nematostella vectensis]|uniref:Uncharacterized protein n=1 Tax=Nematostella vectensis TaxID=45351 RepID=A7RX87_NEMVE|nr:keratin-associated protein 10-4 [Nematostella vectensis]EDO43988.1 predicted protein [Nematostella vectensis]|eukprot:XP_001636051.1 predicted protein [Nematostella vectensis]
MERFSVWLALALFVIVLLVPYSVTHSCSGGIVNDADSSICSQECDDKQCLCSGETPFHINNFTRCNQICSNSSPNTTNVTQCDDMKCREIGDCQQFCNIGSCSLNCTAKKSCTQACTVRGRECSKVFCSSETCLQECYGCTMECAIGVKNCLQTCHGGVCYAVCPAGAKCESKCYDGLQGKPCKVIAGKPTPSPGSNTTTINTLPASGSSVIGYAMLVTVLSGVNLFL